MKNPLTEMSSEAKHLMDFASISTLLGSLVNFLPSVAAILTIVWTFIRIYETDTVQRLLKREK
jgi:hypothetical protein